MANKVFIGQLLVDSEKSKHDNYICEHISKNVYESKIKRPFIRILTLTSL